MSGVLPGKMDPQRHNASLTSTERKRFRDRKAQQTLRDKRERRIRVLEERVDFCERHHGNIGSPNEVEFLQSENDRLRTRLQSLRHILHTWDDDDQPVSRERYRRRPDVGITMPSSIPSRSLVSAEGHRERANRPETVVPSPVRNTAATSHEEPGIINPPPTHPPTQVQTPALGCLPSATPVWSLVPMNNTITVSHLCSWLSRPDLIVNCPPQPSPLALLYGTRQNWLADAIHRSTRLRAIRDSESLAVGWLAYNYSKWRVSPSPATFACLPSFLHPTMAQIQHSHPVGLDLLPWPQLRSNLAENWHKYDYMELTGYLSCCMKVRWPWGQGILERDELDELQICQGFLDVFTKESGWGLTSEFIAKYPELLEGMDIEAVRFQITVEQP